MVSEKRKKDEVNGVLLLNKSLGLSSNNSLMRVKHLFNAKKAGHGGTLDPLATGLLPVMLGEATKFGQVVLDASKSYLAEMCLGVCTDTGDAEGRVLYSKKIPPIEEEEFRKILFRFTGKILQVPPMHSALKHKGKPLYVYARKGIEIERPARAVCIDSIEIVSFSIPKICLRIFCSKGTYIRSLVSDIGEVIECGAHLAALHRETVGTFSVSDAVSLQDIEGASADQLAKMLYPVDALLFALPAVSLDDAMSNLFLKGRKIYLLELNDESSQKEKSADAALLMRVYNLNRFIGLATLSGSELRPKRLISEHNT